MTAVSIKIILLFLSVQRNSAQVASDKEEFGHCVVDPLRQIQLVMSHITSLLSHAGPESRGKYENNINNIESYGLMFFIPKSVDESLSARYFQKVGTNVILTTSRGVRNLPHQNRT